MRVTAPKETLCHSAMPEKLPNYRWVILFVCWMSYCIAYMTRLGLGPLGPFMQADLAITKAQFGLFMSAVGGGFGVANLFIAGWVTDRLGVRTVMSAAQVLGGIMLIGISFTHSYHEALYGFFAAAFALGLMLPGPTVGIVHWFAVKERATAMGIKQTAINLGGLLTAVSFPILAVQYGWRFSFVALGTFAILFGIVTLILYRDPPRELSVGGKVEGGARNASDPGTFVPSFRTIIKSRDLWLLGLAGACLTVGEYSFISYYVMFVKEHFQVTAQKAGFFLAAVELGGLFGKPISGLLSDRLFSGRRKGTFALMAALTTGFTIVIALLPQGSPHWLLLSCSAVFGFAALGWASIYFTLMGEFAGKERAGLMSGFATAIPIFPMMVGVPVFGHLADMTHGWTWSFVYSASLGAIAVVLLILMREGTQQPKS